jgi:hypothetical protein
MKKRKSIVKITEAEFAKICDELAKDADTVCKFNSIGTEEETLLWMLLGILINYLSLSDLEIPCFSGVPTAETYRQAILHVLKTRRDVPFDAEKYIDRMLLKQR